MPAMAQTGGNGAQPGQAYNVVRRRKAAHGADSVRWAQGPFHPANAPRQGAEAIAAAQTRSTTRLQPWGGRAPGKLQVPRAMTLGRAVKLRLHAADCFQGTDVLRGPLIWIGGRRVPASAPGFTVIMRNRTTGPGWTAGRDMRFDNVRAQGEKSPETRRIRRPRRCASKKFNHARRHRVLHCAFSTQASSRPQAGRFRGHLLPLGTRGRIPGPGAAFLFGCPAGGRSGLAPAGAFEIKTGSCVEKSRGQNGWAKLQRI